MSDLRENVKKQEVEVDSATKALAEKHISEVRAKLLLKQPFYGVLLSMTDFIPENVIPTMATDGKRIYYNPIYVTKLTEAERNGVLLHEINHCIYLHLTPSRRLNRDKMRWNYSCFPAGTYITGTNKKIEDIKENDFVIGSDGQLQKVTKTISREYKGKVFTINPMGMLPFTLTGEHPVRIIPKRPGYPILFNKEVWKKAQDIDYENDYLVVPIIQGNDRTEKLDLSIYLNRTKTNGHDQCHNIVKKLREPITLDKDLAWLMGIYTAEGFKTTNNNTGIQFSLHLNESDFRDKIIKIGENLGYRPYNIEYSDDNKQIIQIYSTLLSKFFEEVIGRGAHNKKIPDFILYNKNIEILKSYLDGLFNGDGSHVSKNCNQLSTVSLQLALQTQMAIGRFGNYAKVRKNINKERKLKDRLLKESFIYVVDWTEKVFTQRNLNGKIINSSSIKWEKIGNNFYIPIRSIKSKDTEETVYNLTTEDHTFTVSNALVHNCDYAINLEIRDLGYTLPKNVLMDNKYKNMNAEQIYDQLPKDEEQLKKLGITLDTHIELSDGSEDWDDMEDRVISAYEMTKDYYEGRNQGVLPGGIGRWIKEIRKSKVKWERIFHKFVGQALAKDDFSYHRCNRRMLPQDIYLPDLRSHTIGHVILAIDTSGSITQKILEQFIAELTKISHLADEVTVITCDAAVHEVVKIRNMQDFMKKIKFKGGMGTDFRPVFKEIDKRKIAPELLIYITDAWGRFPEKKPFYPVIWCLTTDSNKSAIPWGQSVELPSDTSYRRY